MRQDGKHLYLRALTALFLLLLAAPARMPFPPGLLLASPEESREMGRIPLEWIAPLVALHPQPNGTVAVTAGDYEIDTRPGAPQIPFTATLIAVPPGTTPVLRIFSAETTTVLLPGPLSTAPWPEGVRLDPQGLPLSPSFGPAAPLPPPAAPVVLEEAGVLRGVRLARVSFYPAIPDGDRLRVYRRVRAEVTFVPEATEAEGNLRGEAGRKRPGRGEDGRAWIEGLIRRAVLNPQDVVPAFPAPPPAPSLRPQGGLPEAFLEVSRPGLYRVTWEDLEHLGFSGANPAYLRLFRGTDEVAYEWSGDGDAVFEPGESIFFYAEPRFSRWTPVDVYRLVADTVPGLPMGARASPWKDLPAGAPLIEQVYEVNALYTPNCFCGRLPPGRDGDRWVWADLKSGASVFSTTFALNGDASSAASLTLWMIGYTSAPANPDHRVEVVLNGVPLGRVEWDGRTAVTATLPIPPTVLAPTNTLQLSLPGIPGVSVEGAWLDGFALHFTGGAASWGDQMTFATSSSSGDGRPDDLPYHLYLPLVARGGSGESQMRAYTVRLNPSRAYRAYDITDPLRPVRVLTLEVDGQRVTFADPGDRPRRYIVATEEAVRAPDRIRGREDLWGFRAAGGATGADYVLITHPAFADALGPLVDLRRSQGLTVAVINVLGVYDAYGDGRPDPEAIRRFLADAYARWDPRPTFVLLVGDGSYDPRRYLPTSPPTLIPPYLADVDPNSGETAADNRYACVDGEDNFPDLLLGRLPVKAADEARAVVRKIVDSEAQPLPGGWNGTVLLVADNPDGAGNFPALSEASAPWVTDPFTVTRRYCVGVDPNGDDCDAEASALHAALLGDWNRGALLIQYFGHSSWQQWARERLFHLDDLPSLANGRRYPVVAEMTCFTGAFHRPEPTLDEALVTRPDAGAVAAWGPTGLSIATGHQRLSAGFFRAVFSDTVATVGEAALAGKLNLARGGLFLDLIDTYSLLGDPATRWNRTLIPWRAHVYLPLVLK